jgi:hypothetical protein
MIATTYVSSAVRTGPTTLQVAACVTRLCKGGMTRDGRLSGLGKRGLPCERLCRRVLGTKGLMGGRKERAAVLIVLATKWPG